MAAAETTSQPGGGWDEAQCTAALAHLEQLQAQVDDLQYRRLIRYATNITQVDNLRLAIPRIIEPFHRPANPLTFKLYAQGVIDSQTGVRNLNQDWRAPETQNIFDHTGKSHAANADLSASTSAPDYGWVERERKNLKSLAGGQEESAETSLSLSSADVARIVEDFKTAHPNIRLDSQNENHLLLVSVS